MLRKLLDTPVAPNLPLAPQAYDAHFQDVHSNVLRLFFNRLVVTLQALLGVRGGKYLNTPYGSFYDTTSQYDGSTTIPYAIRLNSTDVSNGVTVEPREVVSTASIASTTMTVTAIASGRFYPGMLLSGTSVTSGSYVYLQLSSTAAVATSHSFVSGGAPADTTVVLDSVDGVEARQFISGTGVPANTRVVSVDTGTKTVTVSAAFTVQAAGTYSFRPWGYEGTYSVSPAQTVSSTTVSGVTYSKITVAQAGVYNIQFSFLYANPSGSEYDVDIWFARNDVTIANSNSQFTVPKKHGSTNGHLVTAMNFFVSMQINDYVEILWHAEGTSVFIEDVGAQTNPLRPAAPSTIVTVSFVSALPE